ncbi:MAG: SDR family NAD(P)-dependent oxidoreductase [Leptonema sp. (in: bacteria)]
MFDLTNKVVLITGANRGIGRALARGFVKHNAIVLGSIRDKSHIEELEKENIHTILLDVREFDRLEEVMSSIYEKYQKIDCLINNAGISYNKPASMLKKEEVKNIIQTNFEAVFYLCQSYYKLQKKYKVQEGNIINISSVLGFVGTILASVYSGTKGAVLQLTKSLAIEWANSNIRVNAICPGFIETDMTEHIQNKTEFTKKLIETIPLRRLGKPEDIVGAALFLASDYSKYITGQYIVVDGGMTAM